VTTRLLLVRHGQSLANAEHRIQGHLDTPLSAVGVAQCMLLAERLGRERVDALYSSPLTRARATADAISVALRLPVEDVSDLRERAAGAMTGLTRDEARQRFANRAGAVSGAALAAIAGVEPKASFRGRVTTALERIVRAQPDRAAVVVAHRGVIDAACCWALGLPDARFAFGNASVTTIDVTMADDATLHPWVVALNDTSHLAINRAPQS
jgi:broad specificity phosphatase PhoE